MCEWLSLEVPFCKRGWQCVIERFLRGQIEWPDFQYLYLFNKCYDHDWVICLDPSSFYPFPPHPSWGHGQVQKIEDSPTPPVWLHPVSTPVCVWKPILHNAHRACLEWLVAFQAIRESIFMSCILLEYLVQLATLDYKLLMIITYSPRHMLYFMLCSLPIDLRLASP